MTMRLSALLKSGQCYVGDVDFEEVDDDVDGMRS